MDMLVVASAMCNKKVNLPFYHRNRESQSHHVQPDGIYYPRECSSCNLHDMKLLQKFSRFQCQVDQAANVTGNHHESNVPDSQDGMHLEDYIQKKPLKEKCPLISFSYDQWLRSTLSDYHQPPLFQSVQWHFLDDQNHKQHSGPQEDSAHYC